MKYRMNSKRIAAVSLVFGLLSFPACSKFFQKGNPAAQLAQNNGNSIKGGGGGSGDRPNNETEPRYDGTLAVQTFQTSARILGAALGVDPAQLNDVNKPERLAAKNTDLPIASRHLTMARISIKACETAVANESAQDPSSRILFQAIDFDNLQVSDLDAQTKDAVTRALAQRLYGRDPSPTEKDILNDLHTELKSIDGITLQAYCVGLCFAMSNTLAAITF